ncbi:hypothetical protein Scep_018375 [Stephania cephalantha]|uniref:Amidase domain-containing protein n=1 Tax=Stephania cephalantha TaxID=152367 RepID=A0AAP0IRB6_9MAGN
MFLSILGFLLIDAYWDYIYIRYDPTLKALVTCTEELAYQQAKEADNLLQKGVYLGPLHGIPYGLKDISAVPHYKTTWGSKTFKDQILDMEAWIYKRSRSHCQACFWITTHGTLRNSRLAHQLDLVQALQQVVFSPLLLLSILLSHVSWS